MSGRTWGRSTSKLLSISATAANMGSISLLAALVGASFQLQHDDLDAARGQHFDRGANILGVTANAVQYQIH
jgi:hypothetical protein